MLIKVGPDKLKATLMFRESVVLDDDQLLLMFEWAQNYIRVHWSQPLMVKGLLPTLSNVSCQA